MKRFKASSYAAYWNSPILRAGWLPSGLARLGNALLIASFTSFFILFEWIDLAVALIERFSSILLSAVLVKVFKPASSLVSVTRLLPETIDWVSNVWLRSTLGLRRRPGLAVWARDLVVGAIENFSYFCSSDFTEAKSALTDASDGTLSKFSSIISSTGSSAIPAS